MKTRLLLTTLAASLLVIPALAQDSSWDDAGGSASKLWSDFGNWSPDGSVSGRNIFIGNLAGATNDRTLFDDNGVNIESLTITNGADVVNSTDDGATNDFEIDVNGLTSVSDSGSSIILYGGDSHGLDTNALTINDGGKVILDSTTAQGTAVVEVDFGVFDINEGGELRGTGRIELLDNGAGVNELLSNDGTITANTPPFFIIAGPPAGTLLIEAQGINSANARFDWDGTNPAGSVINVNGNQTLDIDVSTGTDGWGGVMNLSTGSTIDMAHTWSLDTGTINVNTGAYGLVIIGQDPNPGEAATIAGTNWTMTGGTIELEDSWDSLQLDAQLTATGGTINNAGTMIFNADTDIGSGVDFNMNSSKSSLVVNAVVNIDAPDFELDGFGALGSTTINLGGVLDLDLGVGADEDFEHAIFLNGGELDVTTTDNIWELNSVGSITAAAGETSRINGEMFRANGDITVTANSTLIIGASTEYSSTTDVVIDAGSTLNNGFATYAGGNYTGGGVFKKGTATILADTNWDVATVDIDDGATTVNNGASLVVNADSMDDAGDGIDNTITVEDSGQLTLNLSSGGDVSLEGTSQLIYNGNIISSTFLPAPANGSALRFADNSSLVINGDGTSDARIKLDGGSLNINDATEDFRMNGGSLIAGDTNEINGGMIQGPGELQIGSGRALRGNGIINAQVDGDSSAQLIAADGQLNVNGGIEDIGTIGTFGDTAILNVSTAWNTNVTDAVVLDRGRIIGSTITNDGPNGIVGNGRVFAQVDNNSLIQANGVLLVQNAANDWDGTADTGVLRANNGTLELRSVGSFLFNGTVEANSGTVRAQNFELEFDPASMMRLSKGTYSSNMATDFGGAIQVVAGASSVIQVSAPTTFESTGTTTLNDTLRLEGGSSFVQVGATFAGGGTLLNTGNHTLTLADGANVGVLVQNEGRLALGASPGQATVFEYQQEAIGLLEIELQGTGLNDYDRLIATGLVQLDGEVEVTTIGLFDPALDDTFTIVSAAGVNGVFNAFDFTAAALDPGLVWDVIYNPTNVQLMVIEEPSILAGDYNDNGVVDAADYTVWRDNLGLATVLPNDGTPGTVDQTDYDAWNANFGMMAAVANSSNLAAVPEPSTNVLLLMAIAGVLALCRRK